MTQGTHAERELARFWNEVLGPKFVAYRHILVDGLTHHSARALSSLDVEPGGRVLDVGCGFGDTAIELAQKVGPRGQVVGLDCCEAFLELAREDAAARGVTNVEFVLGDAQDHLLRPDRDLCFSRFGTMFFENPVAGLRNMRRSLRRGARMAMVVWRAVEENPWAAEPRDIVLEHLPAPGDDALTCGPGPFSMADRGLVSHQLATAGYTEIGFERIDAPMRVGDTPEEAMSIQLALGPAGEVFREAGEFAEQKRPEIEAALAQRLASYQTAEGIVMPSSSWLVTARNGETSGNPRIADGDGEDGAAIDRGAFERQP